MKLSKKEILNIAKLARITLETAEVELYQGQLSAILSHVEKLQALNLPSANVDAADPNSNLATLRPDKAGDSLPIEKLLRTATTTENCQFKIPAVFE